ncbi:hypothetical protein V1264_003453 [Littorina saxatilis]|uniref:Uncharacterized protein n=1 Tax=Littorina saxatilis TaxID=31220 RepID=A0AAN9B5N0_9CAEN
MLFSYQIVADSEQASLGVGAIAGIVAGVIIAFVIAVVIAVFVIKKRRKRTFYNAQTDGTQRNDSSLPNAERESEHVYWEITESETEPPKDYLRPVASPRELPAVPVSLHIGTNQPTDILHSAASLNKCMHQSAATKETGNRHSTDYLHPIASPSESTLKATKQPVCVEQWATSQSQDYLHPIASPSESTPEATKQLVRVELLATSQSQDYLHPIASPSESTPEATKQLVRVELLATSQSQDYLHPIASPSESTPAVTKQPIRAQGINIYSKDYLQPIASPNDLVHARTNQSTNAAEIGTCHSKLYLPHPPAESSNCHAPQPSPVTHDI